MHRSSRTWRSALLLSVLTGCAVAVGGPAAASTAARELLDAAPGPAWTVAAGAARWAAYAAVLVAAGGAAFLAFTHRGSRGDALAIARTVATAAAVGVVATVLRVPLQAAEIGGSAALTDLAAWEGVLASRFGLSALAVGGGLVLLLLGLAQGGSRAARRLAAAGGALAVGALVLAGHSATGEPRWLSLSAMLVHNGAAAVWTGGLVALAIVLRRAGREPGDQLAATVERFSLVATGSVLAVAAAGAAVAWVQVGALTALATTPYGRLLAVKVGLVAAVAAAGAYNHWLLVPGLRREPARAWDRLRRVVGLEVVGVVAVIGVTAALATFTPARVAAGVGELFSDTAALDAATSVQLVVDPNRVGTNEWHLWLLDEGGAPADVADEVHLQIVGPDGTDVRMATPHRAGPGHYLHVGGELDHPGRWHVEVHAALGGRDRTAAFEVVPGRAAGAAPAATTRE